MARRYPNPRRVKLHRSYSVRELANILAKHPNTIRSWLKDDLESFRSGKQTLIPAISVHLFLENKRNAGKRVCPVGTLYCFKCREPRKPALSEVDLIVSPDGRRQITGLCSTCLGVITQAVSAERLGKFRTILKVTTQTAESTLLESTQAVEDCESTED